jgi:hypothetical protein
MHLTTIAIALLALALPATASADPVGRYNVSGTNPDHGGDYAGTVKVTRTGQTYRVVWKIEKDEFSGTGLGIKMVDGRIVTGPASENDIGISIAYSSGDSFGAVAYFEQPDGRWHGVWAYDGWDHIATEDWFPENSKFVVNQKSVTRKIMAVDPSRSSSTPMPALAGPKS